MVKKPQIKQELQDWQWQLGMECICTFEGGRLSNGPNKIRDVIKAGSGFLGVTWLPDDPPWNNPLHKKKPPPECPYK